MGFAAHFIHSFISAKILKISQDLTKLHWV